MFAIQTFLTVAILILFFVRFRIGLCMYIAYTFLIPYCSLNVGGVPFSWNLINTILVVAYCLDCVKNNHRLFFAYKAFVPFFILYGLLLLEMLFQTDVPFSYSINNWRLQVFNLILPIIILSASQYDERIKKYSAITMVLVCLTIAIYGFMLIPLGGINPYIMELSRVNHVDIMEAQFGEQSGRLMIKISSVFTHPMTFGAFLGLATVYLLSLYQSSKKLNKYILISIILALVSCIFLCGIRSPIGALIITTVVFLVMRRNFRALMATLFLATIVYFIANQIPELAGTMASIINSESSSVGGSSIDMRLAQLDAAFDEVENCMLFGKGFGYNGYYWSLHGSHPKLYSFESLIFVILCNNGLVGFLIWGYAFIRVFKYSNTLSKSTRLFVILLFAYYISYTCITGEYGYIKFLLIFYSLIISDDYSTHQIKIKSI